jgi:hypothetical protein
VVIDGEGHVELEQVHQLAVQGGGGVAVQRGQLGLDEDGTVLKQSANKPMRASSKK